jgi:hypothetical protein
LKNTTWSRLLTQGGARGDLSEDRPRRIGVETAVPEVAGARLLKERQVTVTENGKRRQVAKRGAVIAQLVNKSASAESGPPRC